VAFLEKLQLSAGASAGVLNADPNSPVEDGDILRVQSNANLYTDYTLETLTTSLKTRLTGFGDQIGIRHIVYFAKQIQTDVTDDGVFDKQDLVELLRKIEPFVPYVRDNVAN
jgi:ATP adenylyltransferase/5',5'''-P-1,P-4-tetraphosphate phosphorylase II